MTSDRRLAAVLSDFARTLTTDFPLEGILDHLIARIVELLPVTSAGVTLLSAGVGPHLLAASSPAALRFEHLQTSTGEGPCVTAYRTGDAVQVADLRQSDGRFPVFCSAAVEAGLAAVFTFPLRHGAGRLGALDLFRDTIGPLAPGDAGVAQTLADVTAAYLINARARMEARDAAEVLRATALRDPLTGLANRTLLRQRLEHAAARAQRSQGAVAVLFCDLDHFKDVNDRHGHAAGDALLVEVGRRLGQMIRPGDTVARVSGDEFVVLCEDVGADADADALVLRMQQAFREPFRLDSMVSRAKAHSAADSRPAVEQFTVQVSVSASIGVAVAREPGRVGPHLIAEADRAMYVVKRGRAGAGQDRSHIDLDAPGGARKGRRAVLDYQPVVSCADGGVTGLEAASRGLDVRDATVLDPDGTGPNPPDSWLMSVLARGCRDHRRWSASHSGASLDLVVAVGTSRLRGGRFPDQIAQMLSDNGMPPARLVIDLGGTPGLGGDDVRGGLGDLTALGVRLAVTAHDTSHSALALLQRLPVAILTLEPAFVADLGPRRGQQVLTAITDLAHSVGLAVTARGVRTRSQHDTVVAAGCDRAQGMWFGPRQTGGQVDAALGSLAAGGRWSLPSQDYGPSKAGPSAVRGRLAPSWQ